jgi:GR25 family glycosyltransferase involved in LPS biosynthesis
MAVEIVNSGKKIQFDCVDTWQPIATEKDIPEELYVELYGIFLQNIAPVKDYITPVRAVSWEGAAYYADESLDAVFIDAAHDYESVTKDLKAWYPKIKKGGVFAGHDYRQDCGVFNAVNDFFKGRHTVTKKGPCWVVDMVKPVTFDSYRDFKGYVINLDRERWRYDAARKELTGVGFTNISRLSAVDYKETDVNLELRRLGAKHLERYNNDAEIACTLSHFKVMHDFLAGKEEYCLVFEDDVLPTADFKKYADFKDVAYGDFDLLSFGGIYIGPTDIGSPAWTSENLTKLNTTYESNSTCIDNVVFWGSHAYILSRRGAYALLQEYKEWLTSEEYRYPQLDRYISGLRTIKSKLVSHTPLTAKEYNLSEYFGDFFRGVIFQRRGFVSSIVST